MIGVDVGAVHADHASRPRQSHRASTPVTPSERAGERASGRVGEVGEWAKWARKGRNRRHSDTEEDGRGNEKRGRGLGDAEVGSRRDGATGVCEQLRQWRCRLGGSGVVIGEKAGYGRGLRRRGVIRRFRTGV